MFCILIYDLCCRTHPSVAALTFLEVGEKQFGLVALRLTMLNRLSSERVIQLHRLDGRCAPLVLAGGGGGGEEWERRSKCRVAAVNKTRKTGPRDSLGFCPTPFNLSCIMIN